MEPRLWFTGQLVGLSAVYGLGRWLSGRASRVWRNSAILATAAMLRLAADALAAR